MRELGKDETASRTIEVDEEKLQAKCVYTFKFKSDDPTMHEVTTILDFTDCDMPMILRLAARTAVIKYQGLLRKLSQSKVAERDGAVVNVKELYATQRIAKSAREKADSAVDQLSAEEKAALIERLKAELED